MWALTGFALREADRDRPQPAGFNHYFMKPIPLDTLLELLAMVN